MNLPPSRIDYAAHYHDGWRGHIPPDDNDWHALGSGVMMARIDELEEQFDAALDVLAELVRHHDCWSCEDEPVWAAALVLLGERGT